MAPYHQRIQRFQIFNGQQVLADMKRPLKDKNPLKDSKIIKLLKDSLGKANKNVDV